MKAVVKDINHKLLFWDDMPRITLESVMGMDYRKTKQGSQLKSYLNNKRFPVEVIIYYKQNGDKEICLLITAITAPFVAIIDIY